MSSEFLNFTPENVYGRLDAESPSSGPNASFMGGCSIGAFSYLGKNTSVSRSTIGRYCSIAQNIHIGLFNHKMTGLSTHAFSYGTSGIFRGAREMSQIANRRTRTGEPEPKPEERSLGVTIGNDVWIGGSALIRNGLTIGHGAVVAAGAVVVKDVRPYEIVGGVSAKTIRMRFPQEVIDRLLALQWWDYDLSHPAVVEIDKSDIVRCLDPLERVLLSGEVGKAKYKRYRVPNRRSVPGAEGEEPAVSSPNSTTVDKANAASEAGEKSLLTSLRVPRLLRGK